MAEKIRNDGDWWIEHQDDGDRLLREQFDGRPKTVAFIRNGWFGMPRGALITPKQAATLVRFKR